MTQPSTEAHANYVRLHNLSMKRELTMKESVELERAINGLVDQAPATRLWNRAAIDEFFTRIDEGWSIAAAARAANDMLSPIGSR